MSGDLWLGGSRAARFAAMALREWLDAKIPEWEALEDLPEEGWNLNDVPIFERAIAELSQLGEI